MMLISAFTHNAELTDTFLRQRAALGVDAIDFNHAHEMPGVAEHGYPDLEGVKALRRRLRSFGLDINRATLPSLTRIYVDDLVGAEDELENVGKALRVLGEARVPIGRLCVEGEAFEGTMEKYMVAHRGGYLARAESLASGVVNIPSRAELDRWWDRFCRAFERLVPIAEEHDIKLTVHPSDPPNAGAPLGGAGMQRMLDTFPSPQVGLVYCIGARAQAGGSALVIDEINHFGRMGKLAMIHMRNVRGSMPSSGGYEEMLLDDGELNLFKILQELAKIGFNGYINADHIPFLPGDNATKDVGWGYSVGYLKALLAALAA